MKLNTVRIRGMRDILPDESIKWEYVQDMMKKEARLYGFEIIRTPVLEFTDLFERSAGETADIVQKEMYTFNDKGGRSVSLRPEGTAGVLRAVLEGGLNQQKLPQKLMYISPCYRYEKPQAGRLREFYQFGFEIFGGNAPSADAEVMCLGHSIFKHLGIKNIRLHINAVCCSGCRGLYENAVKEYFREHKSGLCNTCQERLEKNPMRIFDCKESKCMDIYTGAPISLSYLCKDCSLHFADVKEMLEAAGVRYTINPFIVRGLDYYTKVVFEFISDCDGVSTTVCGGGRYDNLSKNTGGPEMSAVGMGIGIDRLLLLMENQKIEFPEENPCEVFVIPMGHSAKIYAIGIAEKLRRNLIRTETDIVRRNIKPNLRYANKIKAKYCIIIGNTEIKEQKAKIKDMSDGTEFEVSLGDDFISEFLTVYTKREEAKKEERERTKINRHAKLLARIREIELEDANKSKHDIEVIKEEFDGRITGLVDEAIERFKKLREERNNNEEQS